MYISVLDQGKVPQPDLQITPPPHQIKHHIKMMKLMYKEEFSLQHKLWEFLHFQFHSVKLLAVGRGVRNVTHVRVAILHKNMTH